MRVGCFQSQHCQPAGAAKFTSTACDALAIGPLYVLIDSTGVKVFGASEWLAEKHDQCGRRTWRKPRLAVDAQSGQIVACALTDQDTDAPSRVGPLLKPIYQGIAARDCTIAVVIPPRETVVPSARIEVAASPHDTHLLTRIPRTFWLAGGYGLQPARAGRDRHGSLQDAHRRDDCPPAQRTEAILGAAVLNRMLAAGRPNSILRSSSIA